MSLVSSSPRLGLCFESVPAPCDIFYEACGTSHSRLLSEADIFITIVRLAGTVVLVGLLDPNISFHSVNAVRKQLNILCGYGGTYSDIEASLDLIAKGVIKPQVETGSLADFQRILADLHAGKIKSRIALVPEGL